MQNLTKKISTQLKALRKNNGWSLDKASKHTGVSKAMLGQIERCESSPTIATLWKIASGFDVSFSSFIEDTESSSTVNFSHRSKEPEELHKEDNKMRVASIFPFDDAIKFEVYIIELTPNYTHMSPPHQEGVIEHIIPIEGKVEVFKDNLWHEINQGEGLKFTADSEHGYRNSTNKTVKFHLMIHYNK